MLNKNMEFMENDLSKPLYALTIGEFITLLKNTSAKVQIAPLPIEPFDKEEHFTIDQLQKFLNCSKVTLHNYKKRGMPYYRIGRKLLFKKSEVLEFMKKNVKRPFLNR